MYTGVIDDLISSVGKIPFVLFFFFYRTMCHDTNLLCYTSWNIVRLNALTNHKHAISFLRSRDAWSLESIVFSPPLSPRGEDTIFYDYCGQRTISARRYLFRGERGFQGINRDGGEGKEVISNDSIAITRWSTRAVSTESFRVAHSNRIKRHSKFLSTIAFHTV